MTLPTSIRQRPLGALRRLTLAALLCVSGASVACQCLGNLEYRFRETDRLFVGRVLAAQALNDSYRIEFEPLERLKGAFPDDILYTQPRFMCGMRHVTVGRHYAFFVRESTIGDERYFVASCWSFAIDSNEARKTLERLRSWAPENAIPTLARRPECDALDRYARTYNQLLRRYTKQHPDVIALRKKLEQLRLALAAQFVPDRTLCYRAGQD